MDPSVLDSAVTDHVGRLSAKSGVIATLVLDRSTGSILKSSGQLSGFSASATSARDAINGVSRDSSMVAGFDHTPWRLISDTPAEPALEATHADYTKQEEGNLGGASAMAAMVWDFMHSSAVLMKGFDSEDEMKLVRLRSRKYELAIVPDAKYLLVVVHETPAVV